MMRSILPFRHDPKPYVDFLLGHAVAASWTEILLFDWQADRSQGCKTAQTVRPALDCTREALEHAGSGEKLGQ